MTLEKLIESSKEKKQALPKSLLSSENLQGLVAEGMAVIRKDLFHAGNLAKTAIAGSRRLKSSSDLGASLRLAGHVELLAGRAKKSIPFYRSAREAFAEQPLERAATAVAMLQALAYTGDYDEAFGIGEEALAAFLAAGDHFRAARVRANMANALHRLDRLQEAQSHYELSIPPLTEAGAIADLAIVARNYGVCLMGLQEFSRADDMYSRAREVFAEADERSLILEIDLNRAYLLGRTGMIREAILAYRRLRDSLPAELGFEAGHSFLDQADFMLEVGLWTDAEEAAKRAGEIFERLGVNFELGKARLIEGWSLAKRGRTSEAQEKLKDAKRRLTKEPNSNWHALIHQALAELNLAESKIDPAYKELRKAHSFGPSSERAPRIKDLLLALAVDTGRMADAELLSEEASAAYRAKFAKASGKDGEAQQFAQSALAAYDRDRITLGPSLLRQATAAARESELRECFRSLRNPQDRLGVVARLKNQSLAEITLSPESTADQADLRRTRSAVFQGAREERHDAESALAAKWREARMEAEPGLIADLELPQMTHGTAFAEIFQDEGFIYVFICCGNEVREHVLGTLDEVQRQVRLLRLHLSRRDADPKAAHSVLAWFGDRLATVIPHGLETLYIGRDFPLANIPLHAAIVQGGPLFQQMHVVYAPSAAAWRAVNSRTASATGAALIVGSADEMAPQIAKEVEETSELLSVAPHHPEELETLAPSAKLIHLAAHGLTREDRPLFSSMILGGRELSVFDIMQLSLSAELVTLSGCATGVAVPGETNDSEGFIEALLAAGARSVLASLWEVSDEATRLWMENFYREQPKSGSRQAYRLACADLMTSHPHPAYWAPFALFGAPS